MYFLGANSVPEPQFICAVEHARLSGREANPHEGEIRSMTRVGKGGLSPSILGTVPSSALPL